MSEAALSYKTALPPHIHSVDSLARRYWGQLTALIPLFVTACLAGHAEILRVLLICLVSATTFEFLGAKLFQKKERLQNGEAILAAAIFSLLMPSKCPSEVVILGVFAAVFAAKEPFGGTGAYLLHPLFLARIFLQICFPNVMSEPMLLTGGGNIWILAVAGLGGVILLKQKQGYWETPVLFMSVCFACEALSGSREAPPAFFSGVLLMSFFFLADPVTLPLTRKGTALFILGAAFLSSRLSPEGFSIRSTGYAVLLMNLLTPWLDIWIRPVPYKTKGSLKATYPI